MDYKGFADLKGDLAAVEAEEETFLINYGTLLND